MKNRVFAFFLSLILITATFISPALANSAPRFWQGTDTSGVIAAADDCPLTVERETLTFDIGEFPDTYYESEKGFLAYAGKVSAEYVFRNPTDYKVTAKLVFPFGNPPFYGGFSDSAADKISVSFPNTEKYGIAVDGRPAEATVRYTFKNRYTAFSLEEDMPRLSDGFVSDPFFRPDLPVRTLVYSVEGLDERHSAATAAFVYGSDKSETRVLCESQSGANVLKSGYQVSCWVKNGDILPVRFFGDLPEKELKWTLYENGACEDVIDGTVTLKHSDVTAFSDYALGQYSADAEILDVDKYNATVAFLNYLSEGSGKGVIFWDKWDFSLMRWYEYELSLEPGQTLTNTVTAPLYPDIDASYSPSVYSYKYLLSPAKKWADFGELKIVVKTPYFITKSGIDGFFKTDTGYELSLPGLPDTELEFSLSASESPKYVKTGFFSSFPGKIAAVAALVLFVGIPLLVGATVFAVTLLKKRKRDRKTTSCGE